jgi:hypothetical protein
MEFIEALRTTVERIKAWATQTFATKKQLEEIEITGGQGEKGEDGFSPIVEMDKAGKTTTLRITDADGSNVVEIYDGADGKDGKDGKDGTNGTDGVDGARGTGILKVSTSPTSYTTATGGKNPIKRMSISTIKKEAGVDEVLVGDNISHSYYLYHIYYCDATYAYMDTSTSIRGATGTAGSNGTNGTNGKDGYGITMVDEAPTYTEIQTDHPNYPSFQIPHGKDGYTPVKGVDYFTEADKSEIVSSVLANFTDVSEVAL